MAPVERSVWVNRMNTAVNSRIVRFTRDERIEGGGKIVDHLVDLGFFRSLPETCIPDGLSVPLVFDGSGDPTPPA